MRGEEVVFRNPVSDEDRRMQSYHRGYISERVDAASMVTMPVAPMPVAPAAAVPSVHANPQRVGTRVEVLEAEEQRSTVAVEDLKYMSHTTPQGESLVCQSRLNH